MDVPERLSARVVMPGARPSIHGYDVDGDLAAHYSFSEVVLTALIGRAPDECAGRCFDTALSVAAPISIADAPSHAAVLVALCGGNAAGVASTCAIGLSEQARVLVDEHREFIFWMNGGGDGPVPLCATTHEPAAERLIALRALIERAGAQLAWLVLPLTLPAALLVVLHHCGLREPWQFEAALCVARWPAALAEANAARAGGLRSYPIRLPPFRYVCSDLEP